MGLPKKSLGNWNRAYGAVWLILVQLLYTVIKFRVESDVLEQENPQNVLRPGVVHTSAYIPL